MILLGLPLRMQRYLPSGRTSSSEKNKLRADSFLQGLGSCQHFNQPFGRKTMSHTVVIKDAVKRYGSFTALKGISLTVNAGEFFTLLGPSGCGKTTLLRMIAGFNTIDEGTIAFDDKVINDI